MDGGRIVPSFFKGLEGKDALMLPTSVCCSRADAAHDCKELKQKYGRCLFKRAQSHPALVKVAANDLVKLLCLSLLLMMMFQSLAGCTVPSCTILYHTA